MAVALNLVLTIFIITSAKKPSFLSAGSFCFAQNHHEAIDEKDSRTCATLWIYKLEKGFYLGQHPSCRASFRIFLLLAGDIETCPGPSLKCNMCNKTVRKNQTSATCFGCKDKFHLRCAIDVLEDGCERLYCKDCLPADTETQTQFDDTRPVFDNLNEFPENKRLKTVPSKFKWAVAKNRSRKNFVARNLRKHRYFGY
eukprot:gene19777-21713_t